MSQETVWEGNSSPGQLKIGEPYQASADANSGSVVFQLFEISKKLPSVLKRVERIERSIEQESSKSDVLITQQDKNYRDKKRPRIPLSEVG